MFTYSYNYYFINYINNFYKIFIDVFLNKRYGNCRRDVAAVGTEMGVGAAPGVEIGRSISSYINCLYTNATSLNNKLNELEARLVLLNYPHLLQFQS